MKRLLVLGLLSLGVAACGGPSASGGGKCQQGVCINARVIEPVSRNAPVVLTITVTSDKDIPGLYVSLDHGPGARVDNPPIPEQAIKNTQTWETGANWKVDVKANKPFTFSRPIRLPPREGFFLIVVEAITPQLRVTDSFRIYVTGAGATVYYPGTRPAITPGPLPTSPPGLVPATPRPTLTRFPFSTPGPSPTRPPYP